MKNIGHINRNLLCKFLISNILLILFNPQKIMKKYLYINVLLVIFATTAQAQTEKSIILLQNSFETERNFQYHFRANKGDILHIGVLPEYQNAKKKQRYELNSVNVFRQFAEHEWQQIANLKNADSLSLDLLVPSAGIYTLTADRGGLRKFVTNMTVYRTPAHDSLREVPTAVRVFIQDTLHTYTLDSVVYDYVRVSTPAIEQQTMPKYYEDQIFIDIAYALRNDNKFFIQVQFPLEIVNEFKKAKSVKWGFMLSVSDAVYKALQAKMGEIATAGLDAGVGKIMSGKTDEVTGAVNKNTLQKGYSVFDKAATANSIAGLSGDAAELGGNKEVKVASDAVATITGFTGMTEAAGTALGKFAPKIEDQVLYKVMTSEEFMKYRSNQPYVTMQQGKNGFAKGEFEIINPNQIYYIVIENERKLTEGNALDILEAAGKSMLSQYVYTSVKVFVQREVETVYDKGYFTNSFIPLKNPNWKHDMKIEQAYRVIFESQMKPYYLRTKSENIY